MVICLRNLELQNQAEVGTVSDVDQQEEIDEEESI